MKNTDISVSHLLDVWFLFLRLQVAGLWEGEFVVFVAGKLEKTFLKINL